MTRRLAARLADLARLQPDPNRRALFTLAAASLARCQPYVRHCGDSACPRCMARRAKRHRRRLERRILEARAARRFAFLTLTVGADSPDDGWRALRANLARLRRRTAWRCAVVGGEQHAQIEPSTAAHASRPWNVHVHVVVELREGHDLDARAVEVAWRDLLARSGLRGSTCTLHLEPGDARPWYVTRRTRRGWLDYDSDTLAALLAFLPGQPLVARFGGWRGRKGSRT